MNRWHAACKMLRMIDNCCLVLCNYGVLDAFGRKIKNWMRIWDEWFLNIRCDCVIDIYHNIVIEERKREDYIYIFIIPCQKIINNSHNRMRVEMLLSQNEWLDFGFDYFHTWHEKLEQWMNNELTVKNDFIQY